MRNAFKYGVLALIVIAMIILLAGCGNKPIIATKPDSDSTVGKYDIKLEISFDKDIISSIKIGMTFEDESVAEFISSKEDKDLGIHFEREGNTATCELSSEQYKETYGMDFAKMSRAEIIESLQNEGYTIEQ